MADYGIFGPHIIYRCIIGSRAYGLETDQSDTDRRGFFLPPASLHWSLNGVPEQLESDADQACYWELQKFLTLALKANPSVLECLYTPLVEDARPLAQQLLEVRHLFLTRQIHQTYNGYVRTQFKHIVGDLQKSGTFKRKHAMHLIRLLLAGIGALREGVLPVRVAAEHRPRLMAIRQGLMDWPEIDAWRLDLHREFDAAVAATRLPVQADYAWANAFLLRARRSAVEE